MKNYDFSRDGQAFKLVHVDAYRLNQATGVKSIGLEEIMSDENTIVIIEWPEKIWPTIKRGVQLIDFQYVDANSRRIRGENVALS